MIGRVVEGKPFVIMSHRQKEMSLQILIRDLYLLHFYYSIHTN